MFSAELIRQMVSMLPLYIGEAVFSCLYAVKFLVPKYDTKPLLAMWMLPSVLLDELLFALVPNIDPWHDPLWIAARIILLTLMQRSLFFQRERGMHAFLTASIIAVIYLTKYLIVMPYTAVSDLMWEHIMPYLLNQMKHYVMTAVLLQSALIRKDICISSRSKIRSAEISSSTPKHTCP